MVVKVRRRHDRSFADSEKFVVNHDWENPVWFTRAIVRAKAEAMDSMFGNRPNELENYPAISVISSAQTGEILCAIQCNKDLTTAITCGHDDLLLRFFESFSEV